MWYASATALAAILACSAIGKPKEVPGPIPTHGSLAGDVTATSVIIWSRADGPGTMHVRIGRGSAREASVPVSADGDFTGNTGRATWARVKPSSRPAPTSFPGPRLCSGASRRPGSSTA